MTTLCLDQLLNNKKTSSFVLVNDTIRLSAFPILVDVGKRALAQDQKLIVLLTETSPKFWRQQFSTAEQDKIYIVDAYTDPHGWDEPIMTDKNLIPVRNINEMEKLISSVMIDLAVKMPQCTILIDSITPLAMISQYRTYQLVKALESLTTGMSFVYI